MDWFEVDSSRVNLLVILRIWVNDNHVTCEKIHSNHFELVQDKLSPHALKENPTINLKVEDLLDKVEQCPSIEMQEALVPSVRALISDNLFRHSNESVKVSVVLCIHELIRLTPPHAPFSHKVTKEIFQMTIIALEKLSCAPGRCYFKALRILEIVTQVNSCMILLNVGMDPLVVELFQLFLSTISSKHPPAVFTNMENNMTWMIEKSDDISMELLTPLLASVKKGNQDISSLSWKLGEKVLTNCVAKVKPYLKEAMKSLKLDLDDYAEIVKSICQDASSAVEKEVEPENTHLVRVGPHELELFTHDPEYATSMENKNVNISDDEYYLKELYLDHQTEELKDTETSSDFGVENSTLMEEDQLETDVEAFTRNRGRETTINMDEEYDNSWCNRDGPPDMPCDTENQEMRIDDSLMNSAQEDLQKPVEEPNEFIRISSNGESLGTSIAYESHQMIESMVNQDDGLQLLLKAAFLLDQDME
ncbi:uncharacterized protein Fot_54286 [Forsythia ovata]|uniref:Uncharacterized protein n=1 Tax=Forsythia ovata TaxID=205694 RepID=A0ABD1PHE4_9LAMI